MTTRIDTTHNRIQATIALLQLLDQHITTLHDLAYYRHRRPPEDVRVRGGTLDYALDNHGDLKARQLLHTISDNLTDLIEGTATHAHQIVTYLRTGNPPARRRITTADATADEVLAAIHHQRRRPDTPARLTDQPTPRTIDHQAELSALTTALRKMHPGQRPDRSRLTPLEQQAWRRALDLPAAGKKK